MDNAGTGPGPVTLAAINAAGLPVPATISAITFTPNGNAAGIYNTNPQGLGLALGPSGVGMELISDANGAFSAGSLQIDFPVPVTEFGLNIGDWVSVATLEFYLGGVLQTTAGTAAFSRGSSNQHFQMTGGTFDRVDVIAGGNWVITELVVEGFPAGFAQSNPYGDGCGGVQEYSTYFESFPTNGFDLGGSPGSETVLSHVNTGTGFVVLNGGPAWFTPSSPDLGLAANAVSAARPLGFTATFPGGLTVTDIYVSSNGFVWLAPSTASESSPSTSLLTSGGPRIAMYWDDLRPASGNGTGTIHFDTDPVNGVAYVTFVGVEQANRPAALITMQLAIYATGNFELRYGAETVSTSGIGPSFVGFSPGNGALNPPPSDLSVLPIFTQPDNFVPDMRMASDRPVEGTTMSVTITEIPPGTVLGTLVLSGQQLMPGVQPVPGLGDCLQHVGLSDIYYFFPAGNSFVQPFPVSASGFTGMQFYAQVITLSPGVNPVGIASSNGLEWTVDAN